MGRRAGHFYAERGVGHLPSSEDIDMDYSGPSAMRPL